MPTNYTKRKKEPENGAQRERNRQRDRETGGQTDRETDRQLSTRLCVVLHVHGNQ